MLLSAGADDDKQDATAHEGNMSQAMRTASCYLLLGQIRRERGKKKEEGEEEEDDEEEAEDNMKERKIK